MQFLLMLTPFIYITGRSISTSVSLLICPFCTLLQSVHTFRLPLAQYLFDRLISGQDNWYLRLESTEIKPGNSSVQLMNLQLLANIIVISIQQFYLTNMLDISQTVLSKLQKHQLNNQGCKCEMCQKLNHQENMKIVIQNVVDHQSEFYGSNAKEYYLKIIYKMAEWDKKPRKLRFALPQICVYESAQPSLLIVKKNQDHNIKIIRDKSKMHMFEIIQFFLQGFVYHNPEPVKKTNRKKATSFVVGNHSQKHKNDCVIIAKYRNNFYNMLTLVQMQGLFKSRQKYMRDGLMYLQTLVCTKDYTETRINLNLRELMKSQTYEKMYERARFQVRMFHEQVKSSDIDFITEMEQIQFQNQLKAKGMRQYFEYLTVKIVLALSKIDTQIISQAVFKYVHSKNKCYLIDVRVHKIESNQQFWATAAMKAFQYKLSRRMSMMDVGSSTKQDETKRRNLGRKAHKISLWLQKNTEEQWDEMSIIRTRLERLEKQKKSLMQSQSAAQVSADMSASKSFKIRNVRGR